MEATGYRHQRLTAEARRRIIEILRRGRQSAAQLQIDLQSAAAASAGLNWLALADEIESSFAEVISLVVSSESASCPDHSLCSDLDSGYSRRSPAVKDLGRGNKRRKLANTRTVTAATAEDGRAWRKYGQKAIQNKTYPKSYYRCTHKFDQSCPAVKHVQRIEDNSKIMYEITYISDHTCAPASPTADTSSNSYNLICFSDSHNGQFTEGTDDDATKVGETTMASGVMNEIDLWAEFNDFETQYGLFGDNEDPYFFVDSFLK
ncbi:probable WRKY transcription factor 70 [Cucurbita pepo subsp. pepo]|uniref:probable WRKY transcription factor 70 n=1 Tax=Cucurbita pepo subsp. pepo TaxID=3664 RepID=UPI000C9D3CB7|nr:probable WRKY transcription factor 70 [Cucurbita pepo subsp. pepo]